MMMVVRDQFEDAVVVEDLMIMMLMTVKQIARNELNNYPHDCVTKQEKRWKMKKEQKEEFKMMKTTIDLRVSLTTFCFAQFLA